MKITINGKTLELVEGDITELDTDALVNAANAQLILGSGVAGAIRSKGGSSIQEECNRIGGTYTGGAVITGAGNLKAKYVIHAVGPIMGEGNEDEKLRQAVLNSLILADEYHLKSIAFPAISTGVFGYPIDRCAKIMLQTIVEYLSKPTELEKVVICLLGQESYEIFKTELKKQIK